MTPPRSSNKDWYHTWNSQDDDECSDDEASISDFNG